MTLVLASASPRRRALLADIAITPARIVAPEIDETPRGGEGPRAYARRMALEKSAAVERADDEAVLAADTVVAMGRRILGKPASADEARAMLRALSGRRHRVTTAIAVVRGERCWWRAVTSQVRFRRLSPVEVESYIDTGEWRGKAGGYAIQGAAAALIPWMSGSWSAVVGLPLAETATLLRAAGIAQGMARG